MPIYWFFFLVVSKRRSQKQKQKPNIKKPFSFYVMVDIYFFLPRYIYLFVVIQVEWIYIHIICIKDMVCFLFAYWLACFACLNDYSSFQYCLFDFSVMERFFFYKCIF